MEFLENIDRQLFLFLNSLRADWLDIPMWYISAGFTWIPLFLFFIYYAYKKGQIHLLLKLVLGCALAIALADLISVHLFKNVFQRVRPTHNLEIMHHVFTIIKPNGEEYRGGLYSFVSSHAANFFAISTYIYLLFRPFNKKWWIVFLWAGLIAYSRIYLGVHYPGDLFIGALLGAIIGIGIYRISKRIDFKKKRIEP